MIPIIPTRYFNLKHKIKTDQYSLVFILMLRKEGVLVTKKIFWGMENAFFVHSSAHSAHLLNALIAARHAVYANKSYTVSNSPWTQKHRTASLLKGHHLFQSIVVDYITWLFVYLSICLIFVYTMQSDLSSTSERLN